MSLEQIAHNFFAFDRKNNSYKRYTLCEHKFAASLKAIGDVGG
jgi:hypothetical protein